MPDQAADGILVEEGPGDSEPHFSTASIWSQRAPLLEPNSEIAVAELDGKIYVVGGYPASRNTVATVQIYDSATDSWTLAAPLPVPLNHAMAAAAGGKLYVIGGQSSAAGSGPFLTTVFIFDPQIGTWSQGAPMPTARGGGAAATIEGKIYVVGGRPPHGAVFSVYDPQADDWTVLPDLPTPRNHLAAVALGGRLFVIGGRFGAGFQSEMTDALEIFDPLTGIWSSGTSMPTVRGGLNAVAAEGCIHVFGGEGSGGVFPQHEAYDPGSDSWFSLAPMPVPVHGVTGAAYLNGLIHLPGGGTEVGGSSGSTIHQVVSVEMKCNFEGE
jgi:N-acetylneuraminic acid mutarotase